MNPELLKTTAIGHFLAYYYSDLCFIHMFHCYCENPINMPKYLHRKGNFYTFLSNFSILRGIRGRVIDHKVTDQELANIYRLSIENIQNFDNCGNPDALADDLLDQNYTHGRQISLASKILFLNNPVCISPVDQNVMNALDIQNNIYADFIVQFLNYNNDNFNIPDILNEIAVLIAPIESHFFAKNGFITANNIAAIKQNRLRDKILWVIGKYGTE